ncbi:uncharacterized protein LOC143028604 isoform X2 [Oratosquilla oratoria]|uniref:uncharacterized protein LOC143028604 isoform X2 n=1 Tax=Oratosquilla oratoria TaxID=337810 RepID=UPI003F757450
MRFTSDKPVTALTAVVLCCAALTLQHGIRDFMLTLLPTLAAPSNPNTSDFPPTDSPTSVSPTDVTDNANSSDSHNVDFDAYDWRVRDLDTQDIDRTKTKRETTDTKISDTHVWTMENGVNFNSYKFHRERFPFVRSHVILVNKAKLYPNRRHVLRTRPVRDVKSRVWPLELGRKLPIRNEETLEQEPNKWTVLLHGIAVSAIYWGWLPGIVAGPWIIFRIGRGGGVPLAVSLAWAGVMALVAPICITSGPPWALIALRFLTGLGQGLAYPAVYEILEEALPLTSRPLGAFIVFLGAYVGSAMGTAFGTVENWCVAPYLFGALSVLLAWEFFYRLGTYKGQKKDLLPQLALLRQVVLTRSMATILFCHVTFQWVIYTLILALALGGEPTSWGVPIGLSLQGLATRGLHFLLGSKAALEGALDPLSRRRVPMLAAGVVTGALLGALTAMGAAGSDAVALAYVAVTCLAAGVSLTAAGYRVNLEDVAPASLPRVVTLVNTVGVLPACVAPIVVAALAQLGPTGWTATYSLCTAAVLVSCTIFLFFLSANAASWDAPERPPSAAAKDSRRKARRTPSGLPTATQQQEDDGLSLRSTGNKSFVTAKSGFSFQTAKSGFSFHTARSNPDERAYSCYTADDDLEEDMRSIEDNGSSVSCRSAVEAEVEAECKSVASSSTFKSQPTEAPPPPPREHRLPSILVGSFQGRNGTPPTGEAKGTTPRSNVKWASTPWSWTSGDRTSVWLEAHHDVSLEADGRQSGATPSKAECRHRDAIYGLVW